MKKITLFIYIGFLSFLFVSCSSSDLDPTLAQDKPVEGSISTPDDMFSVLKGALNRMTDNTYYGRDFIINSEVRTDNTFANGNSGRFSSQAALEYNASSGMGCWTQAYRVIASANIILNLDPSTINGESARINHIIGQAHFIRALAHFDLLRNYGQQFVDGSDLGVAIITEFGVTDQLPSRSTVDEVKTFIFSELEKAYSMMDDSYVTLGAEEPNKYAAKALESKVATYFGEWSRVISASEIVINSGSYSVIPAGSYVSSFAQDNSVNSIFELAFSDIDNQGINGLGYIYRGTSYGDVEVLPAVLDIFAEGDVRKDILGYEGDKLRNMGKYPSLNGYDNVKVLRYEEVILNYAEALQESGRDAISVINMIASNRGIAEYTSISLAEILDERRKELMFEGQRFDDLERTQQSIPKKSGSLITEEVPYGDYRFAFAIPLSEMDANSNMVQNQKY